MPVDMCLACISILTHHWILHKLRQTLLLEMTMQLAIRFADTQGFGSNQITRITYANVSG